MQTNKSRITKATAYTHSSAQITRFAEIEVSATGEQTLDILMPASRIEENSIQVQGGGTAILKDVKLVTKHFTEEQNENLIPLNSTLEQLLEKQSGIKANAIRIKSEAELLANLANKIFSNSVENKQTTIEFSPEKWGQTLDFYRSRQAKLDEESFAIAKELNALEAAIRKVKVEMNEMSGAGTKSRKVLEIVLDVKEAGTMQFEISYLVKGASWYPIYDIRVDSESQEIQISYNAMVKNNTGEDWDDVKLSLSTAKPFIGSKPPELSTWFLNKYMPPPPAKPMVRSKKAMASPSMSRSIDNMMLEGIAEEEAYAELAEAPMETEEVTVDTKASSVVFNVGGTSTIISDNQPQKVSILHQDFKTDFFYVAVPNLSKQAYLKAKVTNDSEYPLLAGEGSVFMDNHFVAKSHLKFIAPNQTFEVDLGIDENVKIEHKLLNKFWTSEGFISKNKKKVTFEYLTTIENNKGREVKIIASDQIPKSTSEDIQVELLSPQKYNDDNPNIQLSEEAILKWTEVIDSGKKSELSLKYSVMYPKDVRTALDD